MNDVLTLNLYQELGPDWLGMTSVETIGPQLDKFNGSLIHVRINSPGGDVPEAIAIYNRLREHGAFVQVDVDGLAASGASLVAMAADNLRMASTGTMMIHNAWTLVAGDSHELRRQADICDKYTQILIDVYAEKTGLSKATIRALLDAETWMTASEALSKKFCDSIGQPSASNSAKVQAGRYKRTPAGLIDHGVSFPKLDAAISSIESIAKQLGITPKPASVAAAEAKVAAIKQSI